MASVTKEMILDNMFDVYRAFQEAAPPFDDALEEAQEFLTFITQQEVKTLVAEDQTLADDIHQLALCAQFIIFSKLVGIASSAVRGEEEEEVCIQSPTCSASPARICRKS